jgi:hypothetical protein
LESLIQKIIYPSETDHCFFPLFRETQRSHVICILNIKFGGSLSLVMSTRKLTFSSLTSWWPCNKLLHPSSTKIHSFNTWVYTCMRLNLQGFWALQHKKEIITDTASIQHKEGPQLPRTVVQSFLTPKDHDY